jgi:hypothetical protein
MTNPNSIEHWFPILEAAGVPQPKTVIVRYPSDDMPSILDGKKPEHMEAFLDELKQAVKGIGPDAFLRNAFFSGKHSWNETCGGLKFSRKISLGQRIFNIIEMGECFMVMDAWPWDVWAVREFLPWPGDAFAFYSEQHGNMPVRREFRCFVRDGKIEDIFPYWPPDAFRRRRLDIATLESDWEDLPDAEAARLREISEPTDGEIREITDIVTTCGKALGGYWSVDVLDTTRGWFVTDCALGDSSWHWVNSGGFDRPLIRMLGS